MIVRLWLTSFRLGTKAMEPVRHVAGVSEQTPTRRRGKDADADTFLALGLAKRLHAVEPKCANEFVAFQQGTKGGE